MSVASHPVEWVTRAGVDPVTCQHRAGKLPTVCGIGQYMRDDAVELKRLRRIAQRVDDRVAEASLRGTIGYNCAPTVPEFFVVCGQPRGRGRLRPGGLAGRKVA